MRHSSRLIAAVAALFLACLAVPRSTFAEATITIVNQDGPGEGFNDPTPAAPVGGNPGTTIGQQRLNAFQFAADLWSGVIDTDVEIRIQAAFNPLTCNATGAVLGSAGAIDAAFNSAGTDFPNTLYQIALANKLAGTDLSGLNDLNAQFNSNLGQPGCLTGVFFYYGLDNNHGANIDLVTVLLHEFGHGLGFANFVNEQTGANAIAGLTDIYSQFTFDETLGATWASFDPSAAGNPDRAASALRCSNVSWSGPNVTAAVPGTLVLGSPQVSVASPSLLFQAGAASFGPALTGVGVSGALETAVDSGGASTADGCEPLVGFTAGRIAIIDRGTCNFNVKVANAQAAGAVGAIIADNVAGCPAPGMPGIDPSITIPSVRVTLADGATLKANPLAVATLRVNLSQRAGASLAGRALVNATNPVQLGSSISHWDPATFPNLLMEPAINADLNYPLNDVDMTLEQFQDIGWFKADLSVTQTDSADPVVVGTNYSYAISVTNGGSGTNYPVSVASTLPAGSTFVGATATGWNCGHAAGVVTCTPLAQAGADLPAGLAPSINVTVQAPAAPGSASSTVVVTVPNPLRDPALANNTDVELTQIIPSGGGGVTIGTRTKTVAGTFVRGSTATYTVTIGNSGPGAQGDNPGNEFTDILPAALTLVSASATSGTAVATIGTNTVTWNGSIAAGGSVTITILATVNPANPTGATISNQGTIAFDSDGNGSNDSTMMTDDPAVGGANDPTSFQVAPSVGSYFTLTPCRVVDTRNATGTYGGPPLAAAANRTFPLFGQCAIPSSAKALSVNLTVVSPTTAGNLRLFPGGTTVPTISSINYSAGQTRGNNAIVALNAMGELAVHCAQTSGTAHFVLDVNGYFE